VTDIGFVGVEDRSRKVVGFSSQYNGRRRVEHVEPNQVRSVRETKCRKDGQQRGLRMVHTAEAAQAKQNLPCIENDGPGQIIERHPRSDEEGLAG